MTRREKFMIYMIPLLLIILISKSLFFDEIKVTGDALKFKNFVEKEVQINEEYNSIFQKIGISQYRVVSIKKIKDTGKSIVDEKRNIEISGEYQGKVRGYLFNLFPYKEFRIKSNWTK
ncbi:hypothetical protein [Anaerophilus nitritogenes]|uniref:hypothetical protein n=1 Tax=Anaerophilus nitritogenes TaxID=2498136 RepID=UPI00101B7AF7|nr:hypothetical protein [Anaerophilus nitritogenes]